MPLFQVQEEAYAQTIEHDLRRSDVIARVRQFLNAPTLLLDKRVAFDNALLRLLQFGHG